MLELPIDRASAEVESERRVVWLASVRSRQGRLLMAGGLGWDPVLWESDDGGTTWSAWAALPAEAWDVRVGGLGLVAWGWHESEWWDPRGPTVVESGGYTMTVNTQWTRQESLSISDTHGDTVLTADLPEGDFYWLGVEFPEFIVADHERQVFTVIDPDSGETLMTITYREIEDAFEAAQHQPEIDPATFVTYSADGKVWSEQTIHEITGVTGWPSLLAVGDDLAVMMIDRSDNGRSLWLGTAISAPEGTVMVTVTGVENLEGGHLAGILFAGEGTPHPRALGGFAARVDSDPFSTTQIVRLPAESWEGLFPFVGEDALILGPGTYTLLVWLGAGELGPYSRWVPASSEGLVGCEALVEVEAGQAATVTLTGGFGLPMGSCQVGH